MWSSSKIDWSLNFDSIFLAFNNSFSTYKNSSIISRLNNGNDVDIDDLFFDVYNKSKILNSRTNGLFDPTIGLLIEYYGFGPGKNDLGTSGPAIGIEFQSQADGNSDFGWFMVFWIVFEVLLSFP